MSEEKITDPKDLEQTLKMISQGFNEWRYHNEESVKQGIILPILQALGWDIFDTREVYPQHNLKGGRADYVLYDENNNPSILIEAKALDKSQKGSKLDDNEKQAQKYVTDFNIVEEAIIKKVVITDGLKWYFYKVDNDNKSIILCEYINLWNIVERNDQPNKKKLKELLEKNSDWEKFIPSNDDKKDGLTLYDDFEHSSINVTIKLSESDIFQEQIIHKHGVKNKKKNYCWKNMYEKFCQQLSQIDKNKMFALIDNPKFIGSEKKSFVNTKQKNYYLVIKGLYAYTYKGCNDYTKMMRELLRYFGIWANNITRLEKFDKKENNE